VLRRVNAAPAAAEPQSPAVREGRSLRFGALTLDLDARRLTDASSGPIELTAMEFDLLQALATRPNRVLSRGQLQEFAHGRSADESDRSIDIRVTRLRKKIEPDPEHPRFIKTVRGEGYVFVPSGA
jgi:DNA-binding response OmpR family regulator